MKTSIIVRDEIVGQKVNEILIGEWQVDEGFEYAQTFVRTSNGLLVEIDSTGTFREEPLRGCWGNVPPCATSQTLEELVGEIVSEVVVADCLPTFALVLGRTKLLYASDYGPPFRRFGPLSSELGSFYVREELVDFWTRKRLSAS